MGDLDFLDPVDVLAKLPPDFQTNVESKKWTERRDALQAFLDLLEKNPKLDPKAQYGEMVDQLKKMVEKDANINVAALAVKCLNGMAAGLRAKFAPHALSVIPGIFEKFKEKKPALRDPLVGCIDSVAASISLEQMQDEVLLAMEKPNPNVKIQTDLFLSRAFKKLNATTMPKKTLKAIAPLLIKHTGDSDPEVRDASYAALGSAMRATGEKPIMPLLSEIAEDKMKMAKIKEYYQKILEEVGADGLNAQPTQSTSKAAPAASAEETTAAPSARPVAFAAPVKEIDPFDMLDPVDVLAKLPDDFQTNLESKKWTERRDALQAFLDLLGKNPKLDPKAQYGEMIDQLKKMIEKDANINVAALAAKCLNGIAAGLRAKFAPHALSVIPGIFEKFKEKKPTLRDPLVECIDSVSASISLEQMQDEVLLAMEKPNPNVKIQTDLFLFRAFKTLNSTTMPKKTLRAIAPLLIKHTGDSDPEVRDASYAALGSAMRAIGEKPILPLLAEIIEDKMKMAKIKEFHQKVLEEVGPEVVTQMVQSIHKADPPAAAAEPGAKKPPSGAKNGVAKKPQMARSGSVQSLNEGDDESLKPAANAAPAKKPEKKAAPSPKEDDEAPPEPPKPADILAAVDGKAQRIKDEKQNKLIKWNFTTPTEEHLAQLNQQLGAVAKVSLTQLLFNKDFKQHMKAIDMLKELGDSSPEALVKNSDLLLRWCTLRFFETNPAVLIKVLELCKQIVVLVRDFEEPCSPEEINSFVPYLLLKTGEQKENMRIAVREIINELTDICGPMKLAPLVIEALKTKNSRQRAECLMILEEYVTRGGVGALKSTGIHKSIGACVADRDTSVRNAAINGLVACYREEGDQMWKNVGKLADKDRSLVEERIKRTGAAPGSAKPPVAGTPMRAGGAKVVVPPNAGGTVVRRNRSRSRLPEVDDADDQQQDEEETAHNSTATIRPSTSRYAIDEDFVELTGAHALPSSQLVAEAEAYMPRMPPMPMRPAPTTPLKRAGSSSSISSMDSYYDQLEKVIHNMSSGLTDVAMEALEQIVYMTKSEELKLLVEDRISMAMQAVATQLNLVRKMHGVHSAKGSALIRLILNFFVTLTAVAKRMNMDEESLFEWLYATIPILTVLDKETDEQNKKSFNVTIIRVSQRVEVTVFFVACCKCLQRILREDPNSPCVDLFIKCLYKWQDIVSKQPQPLRLVSFLTAASDFHHEFGQNDHAKTIELCLQHAVLLHGDALKDALRRVPTPNAKMISYINVFMQQLLNGDSNWQPKLPGVIADELPQPKSARQEAMRREIHILVDNVVRDLNSVQAHVARLIEHLEKNPADQSEYDKYTLNCLMGATVRKTVDQFKKAKRLVPVNDQLYITMAQSAMSYRAKLERLDKQLKNSVENGAAPQNILQKRDINTDSFTSDIEIPSNLATISRPPAEEGQKTMRKVRRSIDPNVYNDIRSKLAGMDQ